MSILKDLGVPADINSQTRRPMKGGEVVEF